MERESYKIDPALSKLGILEIQRHRFIKFPFSIWPCLHLFLQGYRLLVVCLLPNNEGRQVCFLTQISNFEGYWREKNICVICPYFSIKSLSILDFELCDHPFPHKFVVITVFWGRWSQVIISNQICIAINFLPFGRHGCVERKLTRKTFHAML